MINLFFSYSHVDEEFRDLIARQLKILERQGIIKTWYDRQIEAGSEIDATIFQKINDADIILLLVSPDFLASDYCYDREMLTAMDRHAVGASVVIPVILRSCYWHTAPFSKLLAVPVDGRPITKWSDKDEAMLQVVQAIKNAANSIMNKSFAKIKRVENNEIKSLTTFMKIARQNYFRIRKIKSFLNDLERHYDEKILNSLVDSGNIDAIVIKYKSIRSKKYEEDLYNRRQADITHLIIQASELGDAESMVLLALLHKVGVLEKNIKKSSELLESAARTGHPEGLVGLAEAIEGEEYGYSFDQNRAIKLYRSAIEKGSEYARYRLGMLLSRFVEAEIQEEGSGLIKSAADAGLIHAQIELALRMVKGPYAFRNFGSVNRAAGIDMPDEGKAILRELVGELDLEILQTHVINSWLEDSDPKVES